jgi:DNA-binding winged helix-turn-helix (wHTH) protein/TolB-like protein
LSGPESRAYQFGPFRIETQQRLLFRGDATIPISPKAADTLLALVSNAGRVVEKDELIRLIWPDSFVEEGGLARNISLLRKALDDNGPTPLYIETIPKRGYRFIATVPDLAPPPPPTPSLWRRIGWIAPATILLLALVLGYERLLAPRVEATPTIQSIAVLPLRHPDPAQEILAEGMTYELIRTLAGVEVLRVTSMTSAMSYRNTTKKLPQVGAELQVDAIVEGTVRQDAGRVSIAFDVVDARTDRQILHGFYQEDARDLLALQSRVAAQIAREIQVKLTPGDQQRLTGSRPPVNPEAWLDYQRGRQQWNKRTAESIQDAMRYFHLAIAKDPQYAQPYAGIADAWVLLGSMPNDVLPPDQAMPQARRAALKAVALDDGLAEGHASLANVLLSYDWNFPAAHEHFERALALNPGYATAHHWYAHYWLAQGQIEPALAEIRQAELQDPQSAIISMAVGWFLYHAGRYDDAIDQYRTTLQLNPSFELGHTALGMARLAKQQYPEALAELEPRSSTLAATARACVAARQGRTADARAVLAHLESERRARYVPAAYLGAITPL